MAMHLRQRGHAVGEIRGFAKGAPSGLDVYVTGPAGGLTDIVEAFGEIDTTLLLAALVIVVESAATLGISSLRSARMPGRTRRKGAPPSTADS
jgi:hypothetical protein